MGQQTRQTGPVCAAACQHSSVGQRCFWQGLVPRNCWCRCSYSHFLGWSCWAGGGLGSVNELANSLAVAERSISIVRAMLPCEEEGLHLGTSCCVLCVWLKACVNWRNDCRNSQKKNLLRSVQWEATSLLVPDVLIEKIIIKLLNLLESREQSFRRGKPPKQTGVAKGGPLNRAEPSLQTQLLAPGLGTAGAAATQKCAGLV